MTCHLVAVSIAAVDPPRVARFWAELLGWELTDDGTGPSVRPTDDTGFRLRFPRADRPKTRQNQMHLDLTSTSLEDQRRTVARVLELGGHPADVGQRPEQPHVVLADPEGNELCVIQPGNAFLAECGFVGALACDGSQEVGYFWSRALGWPLVWDQDEETAIRAPYGGPKITWGGPPLPERDGPPRLHLDIAPAPDGDQAAEVERLVTLGAGRTATAAGPDIVLTDPDGNEFCLLTPRPREPVRAPRMRE